MYFNKLRLSGLNNVDLPIHNLSPTSSYILKAIDGLGPPEVDVSIGQSLYSGGVLQARRPQGREVVMRIALNPNYNVGETPAMLRQALYDLYLPTEDGRLDLVLMNDETPVAVSVGFVKKFEIVPFSKDPEVQITVACLDAYFKHPAPIIQTPPTFDKANFFINNPGEVPVGFRLQLQFTAVQTTFMLTHSSGRKLNLSQGGTFAANRILTIDTRVGSRDITLVNPTLPNAGAYALARMSLDSVWLMLYPGENLFTTNLQSFNWLSFEFTPEYIGV